MHRRCFIALIGGALAVPRVLCAQQKAMPVIGFVSLGLPGPSAPDVVAFRQGLSDGGYIEGKNVAVEYRWAEGHADRLPALATDLVGDKVDLIATVGGTPAALAAKTASSTTPIVSLPATTRSQLVSSTVSPARAATSPASPLWRPS